MRNRKRLFVLGLALMMVFSFAAMSAAAEEPKFDVYKNIVDFAVVKAVVDGKTKGVIIDARPKRTKYDKGHIPGSLSQSWSKFKSGKVNVMPKDKGTLVIFFCGGLKCPLSHKSAFKAEKMGYTNLAVYAAGMPDWKKNGGKVEKPAKKSSKAGAAGAMAVKPGKGEGTIDVAYFQEVVAKTPEKIYIVDTRDPAEYKSGHFKSSVNIPSDADKVEDKLKALKTDKPVVFVCSTGARSGELYYMLIEDVNPGAKGKAYFLDATIDFKKDGSYTIKAN